MGRRVGQLVTTCRSRGRRHVELTSRLRQSRRRGRTCEGRVVRLRERVSGLGLAKTFVKKDTSASTTEGGVSDLVGRVSHYVALVRK